MCEFTSVNKCVHMCVNSVRVCMSVLCRHASVYVCMFVCASVHMCGLGSVYIPLKTKHIYLTGEGS